jgi:transposase
MEERLKGKTKVELFEQMRREYAHGVGSIKGVAKKFGVHRRMVRDALGSAVPAGRKQPQRGSPKMDAVKGFIDAILLEDRKAPRKQRHTAHRIFTRIGKEVPECSVAESSVRRYVRAKKRELGLLTSGEIYVPQSYQWGVEAQVDWYEAYADLDGEREKVQVFSMRSMASGGSFHYAYRHATQQAFLEAHERAFDYFGGVFRLLRYDNLTSAVKKILRGYQREETARFVAFRSHWGYEAQFCNAAKGNEKGGVEGDVGYSRRNYLVPVPQVKDLAELNAHLLARSREEEERKIGDRVQSVGAGTAIEREHLLPLAAEGFELAEVNFLVVDGKGCVKARTNWYSTPLRAGTAARVRVLPGWLEVWHEGRCVARHERSYGRGQQIFNLEHYLEVLQRKPGALAGSTPLQQWREQGRWPESYDRLWGNLIQRSGKLSGTRAMVELLLLGRECGYVRLQQAVDTTLAMGSSDAAVVRYLMMTEGGQRRAGTGGGQHQLEVSELGALVRYERPLPSVRDYDQLLGREVIQ